MCALKALSVNKRANSVKSPARVLKKGCVGKILSKWHVAGIIIILQNDALPTPQAIFASYKLFWLIFFLLCLVALCFVFIILEGAMCWLFKRYNKLILGINMHVRSAHVIRKYCRKLTWTQPSANWYGNMRMRKLGVRNILSFELIGCL